LRAAGFQVRESTHAAAAKNLWDRAAHNRLSAATVNEELSRIVPDRPMSPQRAAARLPKLLKALSGLSGLSDVELHTLAARVQDEQMRRSVPAAA